METSWVYELAAGKTDLLCQGGYGASLGCSSMHLSYAKVMVAEEPQAGSPRPAVSVSILDTSVWGLWGRSAHSLVLNAPADTHIAVSRNHDTRVVGALLSPFTFLAMLCAVNPSHALEVSCTFVHSVCHCNPQHLVHPTGPSKMILAFFFCSLTPFFSFQYPLAYENKS